MSLPRAAPELVALCSAEPELTDWVRAGRPATFLRFRPRRLYFGQSRLDRRRAAELGELRRMKPRVLSSIGCVVGLLGIFAAVLAHHVISRLPEQPPGWQMDVDVGENFKWQLGNRPAVPPEPAPVVSRDTMSLAAIAIGCVAIAFAVASWIRREGVALGVLAAFLGTAAIAWEQVLFVFALFVFAGGPMIWVYWLQAERQKANAAD
jgi:hypothetical protein